MLEPNFKAGAVMEKKNDLANIVETLQEKCELSVFMSTDGRKFQSTFYQGVRRLYPLASHHATSALAKAYNVCFFDFPSQAILKQIKDYLALEASGRNVKKSVYIRVAKIKKGVEIALGNSHGEFIRIMEDGYEVVSQPKARFYHPEYMQALTRPEEVSDPKEGLELLGEIINVNKASLNLVSMFMLKTMVPSAEHPILVFQGEEGSGKGLATQVVRSLLDPYVGNHTNFPTTVKELHNIALNNYLLCFDNFTPPMKPVMADALCRLSTGGGITMKIGRAESELATYNLCRPIIINGIGNLITRGDLLDRCIVINLKPLAETWRGKKERLEKFEKSKGRILGSMCLAVSEGLKNIHNVKLDKSTRMDDFLKWSVAAGAAFGWKPKHVQSAYERNRQNAKLSLAESEPIIEALVAFMGNKSDSKQLLVNELLDELTKYLKCSPLKYLLERSNWPKLPNLFSGRLSLAIPLLRAQGVEVTMKRTNRGSLVTLKTISVQSIDQIDG